MQVIVSYCFLGNLGEEKWLGHKKQAMHGLEAFCIACNGV